jgi:hypothetical protein
MTGQDKRRMYKRLSTVAVEEEGADFGDWVEMVGLQLGSNDEVYGQSPV